MISNRSVIEMTVEKLEIKEGRLLLTIHETAESFGAFGVWGPEKSQTGVKRLALSDFDKGVRDWFVQECESLGCTVKIDEVGNIFAIYPGKNDGPPTGIGSHLDTQPNGGRYDGIYGVLSGLELIRTFKDNNYVPNYPVAIIDWTNEEGARFPTTIVASSVWAGIIKKEDCLNLKSITDETHVTFGEELERIGYNGSEKASYQTNPLAAHFEIHIEQGPVLENLNKKIGIVTGVQAYTWNMVTVKGSSSHAGTTPMKHRADALQTASKLILAAIDIAKEHDGLATIGTLSVEPALINVIPDVVKFSLDTRHVEDDVLDKINAEIKKEFESISSQGNTGVDGRSLTVEMEHLQTSSAVKFNPTNISTVKQAATNLFGEAGVLEITSGAGHDSCATNSVVPTSMIFIPSKNGISHNPEEYSAPEEISNGFKVLLDTIVLYDEYRVRST